MVTAANAPVRAASPAKPVALRRRDWRHVATSKDEELRRAWLFGLVTRRADGR
jgi:hypothetical protein